MHYPSINLNIHPSLCSTLATFPSLLSLPISRLGATPSQRTIFSITICPPLTSFGTPAPPPPALSRTHIAPLSPPPTAPCPSSLAHAAAGSHHGSKPRRLPHAQRGFSRHADPPDGGAQHQQPPTHFHDPVVGRFPSSPGWAHTFIPFAPPLCACVFCGCIIVCKEQGLGCVNLLL